MVYRQEHALVTETASHGDRLRRVDAESPCLVTGCGNDGPRAGADDDRPARQFRMPRDLTGREESIHIDVQDGAAGLVMPPVPLDVKGPRRSAHASIVRLPEPGVDGISGKDRSSQPRTASR